MKCSQSSASVGLLTSAVTNTGLVPYSDIVGNGECMRMGEGDNARTGEGVDPICDSKLVPSPVLLVECIVPDLALLIKGGCLNSLVLCN